MTKQHKVLRKCGVCLDVGCPDFDRAKRNRELIAKEDNLDGYIEAEKSLKKTPIMARLPWSIPHDHVLYTASAQLKLDITAMHEEIVN
jgi:hypothetical protein